MAKIISIDDGVVSIGTDDKGIREARLCDFNFTPEVGDEVDIYETETKLIVVKRENYQKNQMMQNTDMQMNTTMPNMGQNLGTNPNGMNPNGININVTNTQLQPQLQQPQVQQVVCCKVVDKVVYCILAGLLGSFGIHKFYARRIGTGLLYLIFGWTGISFILSIIDLIKAILTPSDVNGKIIV